MKTKPQFPSSLLYLSFAASFTGLFTPQTALCQTPIVCGQTITNSIAAPQGFGQYYYAGTAGETLVFSFVGYGNCFSFGNDAVMDIIYNPNSQIIASLSHCGSHSTNLTLAASG